MSATGQKRTLSASLDYLIGASDERIRNVETERSRGLEIDAQLDFPTLLDWQFAGLFTFKNSSDVDACHAIAVGDTATIAHQTASHSELLVFKDRRHRVADSQCGKLFRMGDKECAAADHEPACPHLNHLCEGGIKIAFRGSIQDTKLHSKIAGRFLHIRSLCVNVVGIDEIRDDSRLPNHLMQQLQPLR